MLPTLDAARRLDNEGNKAAKGAIAAFGAKRTSEGGAGPDRRGDSDPRGARRSATARRWRGVSRGRGRSARGRAEREVGSEPGAQDGGEKGEDVILYEVARRGAEGGGGRGNESRRARRRRRSEEEEEERGVDAARSENHPREAFRRFREQMRPRARDMTSVVGNVLLDYKWVGLLASRGRRRSRARPPSHARAEWLEPRWRSRRRALWRPPRSRAARRARLARDDALRGCARARPRSPSTRPPLGTETRPPGPPFPDAAARAADVPLTSRPVPRPLPARARDHPDGARRTPRRLRRLRRRRAPLDGERRAGQVPLDRFDVPESLRAIWLARCGAPDGTQPGRDPPSGTAAPPGRTSSTGPVAVDGARAGDVLAAEVLDAEVAASWGWNAIRRGKGASPATPGSRTTRTKPSSSRST